MDFPREYKLNTKTKTFLIIFGIISLVLIIGILFFILIKKAKLVLHDDHIEYWWMGELNVKYEDFEKIKKVFSLNLIILIFLKPLRFNLKEGSGAKRNWGNIAVGAFEKRDEVISILSEKTGIEI